LKNFEEEEVHYNGEITLNGLNEFFNRYGIPSVMSFGEDAIKLLFDEQLPALLYFHLENAPKQEIKLFEKIGINLAHHG